MSRGLLVHDWIEPTGGSEKVVDEFATLFPDAPLFCLWSNDPGRYPGRPVHESWMGRSPLRDRKALSLALMSRTMRRASPAPADWALVSSHSFAHHFGSDGTTRRLPTGVYVHSPARYLWAPEIDPRGQSRAIRSVAGLFRAVDRKYAGAGASYSVNSQYIADRVRRTWGLESTVIHPPIDVDHLTDASQRPSSEELDKLGSLPADFVLGASRFVTYKRLDAVIKFGEDTDRPVVLAGSGEEEPHLRHIAAAARVPVHFFGRPSDAALSQLYRSCALYVFPPVEDFGMMPAEALACGARVIVNREGGAGEILSSLGGGVSHDFERENARAALDEALRQHVPTTEDVRQSLGPTRFRQQVYDWLDRELSVELPPAPG